MTPVVSLYEESRRLRGSSLDGFYIPQFEVRIEGVGLPRNVLRDVIQLTYKDNIKTIDSFELTVNNWNPSTNNFKYVGSETAESLQGDTPESQRFRLFEPCRKEVKVYMGYVGNLRVMLTGNFTTMGPNFSNSGAPTLTVRGLNILHQLRRKQNIRTWRNKKISQAVKSLESTLPIPIDIDRNAQSEETPQEFIAQRNQYDIDFIFARARERGYVVFIQEADPNVQGSQPRLYFGPSHGYGVPQPRGDIFQLEWGKSLIDFKPTLTTANQIRSVTVRGWHRRSGRTISATVNLDDRRLNRNRDLYDLLQKCDPREEVVVDEPIFSQGQARQRAIAILMDRQKEMVKASGTTIGLPDLRAGNRVLICNLGSRFSGVYFVEETTHTINDSGYITKFKARREDDGRSESQ